MRELDYKAIEWAFRFLTDKIKKTKTAKAEDSEVPKFRRNRRRKRR